MSFDAPNLVIKKWQYPGVFMGVLAATVVIIVMCVSAMAYQIVTSFCNKFGVTRGFYEVLTMYQEEWAEFMNKYGE